MLPKHALGDLRDSLKTIFLIRWGVVALGITQAFLIANPPPIGGPWIVLAGALFLAFYNLPGFFLNKFSGKHLEILAVAELLGDFLVCTLWVMMTANDIYATSYAIYALVSIETAALYRFKGILGFSGAFLLAQVGLYLERFYSFGFRVEIGSLVFRSGIVILIAFFVGLIADQSYQRRLGEIAAREEAEKASAAKSAYLSRMSHELRTPLTAILGFGELLAMKNPKNSQKTGLAAINKAGKHLLSLINDVLDISRIEAGREHLSIESVEIYPLVQECMSVLAQEGNLVGVRLELSGDTTAKLLGDWRRMRQVILNLLGNAVRYNQKGGAVETIITTATDTVTIQVQDTGVGIPKEAFETIFEPFHRLNSEQILPGGSGLGLSVVKKLVEEMHGTITVTSEVGAGSTFIVTLPKAPKDAPLASSLPPLKNPPSLRRKLLYIEDDPVSTELIGQILKFRANWTLVTAATGEAGWQALQGSSSPDLLLLDLHLPDLTGEEILARIHKSRPLRALPVIVLSADATSESIAKLQKLGVWHYLTKPLRFQDLLDLVDEVDLWLSGI